MCTENMTIGLTSTSCGRCTSVDDEVNDETVAKTEAKKKVTISHKYA